MVLALDSGVNVDMFAKNVYLLKSMFMLKRAFFLLTPDTINNCFRKSKIERSGDAPFLLELEEEVNLPENIVPETFEELVNTDEHEACYGNLTDAEIVEQIQQSNVSSDEDDTENVQTIDEVPTSAEALTMVEKLETFCSEYSEIIAKLDSIEHFIECKRPLNQVKITKFFR